MVAVLHLLGIALLVGCVLALDLVLLGLWRAAAWREAVAILAPLAALGFVLAAASGGALLSVRAGVYVSNPALQAKAVLIALALLNVLIARRLWRRERAARPSPALRASALASAVLWIGVVVAGRWIAFAG